MDVSQNYSNISDYKSKLFYERSLSETIEISYNLFAICIGIPINFWAFYRYCKLWHIRRGNRRLILGFNLTVANILILLLYCPTQIAWLITISWPWGEIACRIRMFASVLVYHLSSNAVVIIALEMLRTLCKPLKTRREDGVHRSLINVLCCWLMATLCSCPQFFTWGLAGIPGLDEVQCVSVFTEGMLFGIIYQLIHLLTVFYIPLLIIILCYAALGLIVGKQLRNRKFLHAQMRESSSSFSGSTSRTKRRRSNSSSKSYSSSRSYTSNNSDAQNARIKWKLIKVSAAVISSYILCWLPYQVLAVWSTSVKLQTRWSHNTSDTFDDPIAQDVNWLEALMISSACINPILYTYHGF